MYGFLIIILALIRPQLMVSAICVWLALYFGYLPYKVAFLVLAVVIAAIPFHKLFRHKE